MRRGRLVRPLTLSPGEREQLLSTTRSRALPHALVVRPRLVVLAADGLSNGAIAKKLEPSRVTVGKWRKRCLARGLAGLYDGIRPGGPRSIGDEQITTLMRRTFKTKPKNGTH